MKWGQSKKAGTVVRSKQQLDHHQQEQEAEAEAAIITTCSSKTSWHKAATLRIQSTMLPFLLLVSMMVIPVPSFAGTHTLLPPFAPPTFHFCIRRMYMYVCAQVTLFCVCMYKSLFSMWVCVYVHKSFYVCVCFSVFFALFFLCKILHLGDKKYAIATHTTDSFGKIWPKSPELVDVVSEIARFRQ